MDVIGKARAGPSNEPGLEIEVTRIDYKALSPAQRREFDEFTRCSLQLEEDEPLYHGPNSADYFATHPLTGQILGYIITTAYGRSRIDITSAYVDHSARRNGVYTTILRKVVEDILANEAVQRIAAEPINEFLKGSVGKRLDEFVDKGRIKGYGVGEGVDPDQVLITLKR
ncbi:MAG: hypothetical protein KGH72_00275 [Candidatus Micrarchaeota archaeon]|nr:hypothetical protein [Candidatus Micrarchaeota archaeon]